MINLILGNVFYKMDLNRLCVFYDQYNFKKNTLLSFSLFLPFVPPPTHSIPLLSLLCFLSSFYNFVITILSAKNFTHTHTHTHTRARARARARMHARTHARTRTQYIHLLFLIFFLLFFSFYVFSFLAFCIILASKYYKYVEHFCMYGFSVKKMLQRVINIYLSIFISLFFFFFQI